MPSKIIDAYRQALAQQGASDDRPDDFIVRELGPIIQQEAPQLFDADPELGELWSQVRDADAPSLPGEFSRAFKSGLQGLASTALGGASLVTGSDYLRNKAASFDEDAAANAPTVPTLEDIAPGRKGVSKVLSRDALRYAMSKVGQVAPSIAEAGVVAGAGALAGSAVAPGPGTVAGAAEGLVARSIVKSAIRQLVRKGIAEELATKGLLKEATEVGLEQALKSGSKEIADVVGRQAMSIGAKRGLAAANLTNSYLLNAGDVYSEGGDRPTALALGLISAIPDSALPTMVLGRLFPGVAASQAKELGKMYLADRAKKLLEAAGVVATEGATEYFQEGVNVVARNLKEGKDPLTFTDADLRRFREAGIAGAAGGAVAAPAIFIEPNAPGVPAAPPVAPPPVAAPPAATVPIVEPAPAGPVRSNADIVRAVAAMPNEEKWVRLAELGARARSADEETEFQLLQAQAPLPPSAVPPDELAAVAQAAAPGVPAEVLGRQMMGDTAEARAEAETRRQAFAMAGAPVPNAASEVEATRRDAELLGRAMVGDGVVDPQASGVEPQSLTPETPLLDPRLTAQAPALEPEPVAPVTPPVTAQPPTVPDVAADLARYNELQSQMTALGPEKFGTPEYKAIWQASEDIKNRHGGMPPGQVSGGPVAESVPIVPPEPIIAKPTAEPAPQMVFEHGPVIEGAPSVDFRTNEQFQSLLPDQWNRVLTTSLESGPRSDKSGNRSLTRVALAMQGPDGRVVVAGLTLPQKTLTTSGKTTFNEAAVQRMGVSRAGRRAVEAGGNHPATVQDVIAAGYQPIAVVHFSGDPGKIFQTFADAKGFDQAWGSTEKTQGQQIRPPAMTAQPAIARNREADITRRIDQLGNDYLRAKDQAERNKITTELKALYGELDLVAGREQGQTGEVPLDDANHLRRSQQATVQSADRASVFQAVAANLQNLGMKVDVFAKEFFAQAAREPIIQQIEQLKAQLPQAQGSMRAELTARIAQREARLAELAQAVGVAYSPWHVAISLDDVQKANLGNLVTLLHEAAESLTMRLNPVAKGLVLRAVDASMVELQAKAQQTAERNGMAAAPTTSAADLLAETMAQKLADAGVADSQSLAQAIVRWIKDLYYRTAMAVQRGFGAEPNAQLALDWFENQLRRETGGDFDYRLSSLMDRFLTVPMTEQVRKFHGAKDTPGSVADFFDPLDQSMRQPWVEPISPDAMRWNVEFRQSDAPSDQNIPDPEARARIDSAAVHETLALGRKLHAELAPKTPWEQFWKLVGRGDDPVLLLADQERRVPGTQSARIGGARMTKPMNDLAGLNARILVEKMHLRQLRELARSKKQIDDSAQAMVDQAKEMNKLESDLRNASLHEDTLRAKLRKMATDLVRSMRRGLSTAHTHGRLYEAIQQAEGLLETDPMPEAYQRVLKQAVDGTLPIFDSVRALAELDLPLADMTNAEVVKAIRDNAEMNPQLRAMAENRPLAVAIAALARSNIEQVDQIQLGWLRDTTKFREIHKQLDEIRSASADQISRMVRQMDERASAKGLAERIRVGYLKRRRALQTMQNRVQIAEERVALLEKAIPITAEQVNQMQQTAGGAYSEWYPVEGAKFTAMVPGDSGAFTSERRTLSFNPDGSAKDSDQIKRDLTNNMEWLRANADRKGTRHFETVKRQTMELAMLDVQKKYPAGWVSMLDKMVQPLGAEAKAAGHSSGARIAQMLQQFEFINRSHREEVSAAAGWWTKALTDVEESTGITDHGQMLGQVYDPVMYFLNVNPGLDEQHAIREATRMARQLLTKPPAEDFNEKFATLLRRTKENSELMLKIAEQYGVFVKDPRISNALRQAVAQGWLTTPRSLRADVLQTIVRDMEQAGWKLQLKEETGEDGTARRSVVRATTFDGLTPEDLDPKNSQALSATLKQYFTPGILDRWLVPFINKPGSEIFSWAGDPIPQLEVQQAWTTAGGDVLQFIDNLAKGRQLQVNEETAADPLADFRGNILGQIDRLFGMEAKLAYESQQVRDLFDPMGPKPHTLMDARMNDLLPPEHVQFQSFDPTSSQRLLGMLAFHGAFGRNGDRMVQTVNELKGVLAARKAEFDSLKGTTKGARAAEAAARGLDYKQLEAASDRYSGVLEMQSKIRGLFGVGNTAGPFADLRGGMEVMNAMTGQLVDNPKVGAYNLLSLSQRPFAMRSLGPMTISASARAYANLLETTLGSFLENLNIHVMRSSEYAKDVGSVEGQVFRNLPWGTVLADIGHRGKFQSSKTDRFLIKPLRALRSIQRKGVKVGIGDGTQEFPRLALIPGFGVLNSISQIAAQANTLASVQMYEKIVRNGLTHFSNHPDALHDPSFRFTDKQLKIGRFDKGVLDYFRDKSIEYGIGNLEDVIRQAAPAAAKGDRLLTRDQVLRIAQMTANELDGAASINTTPSVLQTNPLLKIGMPLLRWPLWMMHNVHQGLNTADGQRSLKAMAKGLGTLALWNLPMGIAFSLLLDQYDDKLLGKKSNLRSIDALNAIPLVGPALGFIAGKDSPTDNALALLERSARAGNVYGLGADLAGQLVGQIDPSSGQRGFSLDQRVFAMSQFLSMSQSLRNLITQGGDATWASVGRQAFSSMGGNGVLHSIDITNNLLGLDNAESRLVQRINAQNWLRSAGREVGIEVRASGGGTANAPTPMTVWTREMSLSAMANDRLGFLDNYRKALNAAREQVADDPRISPVDREKEAAKRVLASWQSRNPLEVFRFKPTTAQLAQLYTVMDDDGRADTQEAIRRYDSFTSLIKPTETQRYFERQMSSTSRSEDAMRRRMNGSGMLFSSR